ncbi:MAG: T9SS type A sorting domain-containing protein [Bacteroidetes bacterium]|nr:T9SS type A sorting domain-containing protein [Bacteroidota bacterium]
MKHTHLFLAILVYLFWIPVFNLSAQEIEWENTIQGVTYDNLYSVDRCVEGGCILGGYSASGIGADKTKNTKGVHDYWVLKLNDLGNIEWQNSYGGGDADLLQVIHQTSEGGYIFGGYSASNISVDKSENKIGTWDFWIIKTDANGNKQWDNTIGGTGADYLYDLKQTSDGGYIVGGPSQSPISGDKTKASFLGTWDYWILKLDTGGNIQWQTTLGGDSSDFLYSIEQTKDGGYIAGGYSYSGLSGDKTDASKGSRDYWVVKLDNLGNLQWQKTIGGSNSEFLTSIQQCRDGGYILGGNSGSGISGDKTELNNGPSDYWIVKLDSTGNIVWQNSIGGSNGETVQSIQQTPDGGFAICGTSTSGASGDKSENAIGGFDYWIVKVDSVGTISWENTIGGSGNDYVQDMCVTREGDLIVVGYSESPSSGDKTEATLGVNDYWVVKIASEYNLVTGKMFADLNNNLTQDPGEPPLARTKIVESAGGRFTLSQPDGSYKLVVMDTGSIQVSPASIAHYTAMPPTRSVSFSGFQQASLLNDFPYQASGVFNDLSILLTPFGTFRAGLYGYYMINYKNVGTTNLSGNITFFPDSNLTYISSSLLPNSITSDSVTWNIGNLAPFQEGTITLVVSIPGTIQFNTLLTSAASILAVGSDSEPSNNYATGISYAVNSHDPNDIVVNRKIVYDAELIAPPWLEYTISFQNTGNAAAINVHILNEIQKELDINSFEFIASSHAANINYSYVTANMDFGFDNINLPDSNSNEPSSHGFIRYRIKPQSTLLVGDSIRNKAAIYFDFNNPVITNNAVTHILAPNSILTASKNSNTLLIYPNPTSGTFTLNMPSKISGNSNLKIRNLVGKAIYQTTLTNTAVMHVDIRNFSAGIYIIEIESQSEVYRSKLVKQN